MNKDYYEKYIKYKNKYLESKKLNQKGGLKSRNEGFPTQDVYENSIEPVWKNIIANEINDFIDEHYNRMEPKDIVLFNNFIEQFNSLYESDVVLEKLNGLATSIDNQEIKPYVENINTNVQGLIKELFNELNALNITNPTTGSVNPCDDCVYKTPYTVYDIGRIANKKVFILDQPVGEFSLGKNYFESVGELISPYSNGIPLSARNESYYQGFLLTENERQIIIKNVNEEINVNNSMLQMLLILDRNQEYGQDLTRYEINKSDSKQIINRKISEATIKTYFYVGKLFGTIANQLHLKLTNTFYTGDIIENDPIQTFLLFAGILKSGNSLNDRIAKGFQQIALSHIAHGMSSAELVARIASSVRTSYPQSLISALCVRSGAYHGGAMQRAIPMIITYFDEAKKIMSTYKLNIESIESDPKFLEFVNTYVSGLFKTGKIFGLGHRIHKSPDSDKPCADPRALEYLEVVREIYHDTKPLELLLVNIFLQEIKRQKPSLGCNSDFAIAVFCVLTSVPETDAEGMFVMCRIPGFCARIVRELLGKPNARRLPFAPILPYIPPKE